MFLSNEGVILIPDAAGVGASVFQGHRVNHQLSSMLHVLKQGEGPALGHAPRLYGLRVPVSRTFQHRSAPLQGYRGINWLDSEGRWDGCVGGGFCGGFKKFKGQCTLWVQRSVISDTPGIVLAKLVSWGGGGGGRC